jgi:hypothetical protein
LDTYPDLAKRRVRLANNPVTIAISIPVNFFKVAVSMFLMHPLRSLRFSFNRIHLQYIPPINNINVIEFNIEKYIMNIGCVISDFNESNVNDDSSTLLIQKG